MHTIQPNTNWSNCIKCTNVHTANWKAPNTQSAHLQWVHSSTNVKSEWLIECILNHRKKRRNNNEFLLVLLLLMLRPYTYLLWTCCLLSERYRATNKTDQYFMVYLYCIVCIRVCQLVWERSLASHNVTW